MLTDSNSALSLPRRFGRYEVVRSIGRGAMGELLEGRHVDLGTRVAIKVVRADVTLDEGVSRRVLREGRATAAIRHPHVVTVLDVGEELGRPFLVMELLEGEDLAQRLRGGPLSAQEAADLMLPITSALAAAHDAGVVHRDLKPSNVFLAKRRDAVDPVVVDFGISKSGRFSVDATSSQCMAGTPQYMAPERFRAPHDATPLSDQYSLGVVLYECLTGDTPFAHEHYYDLLQAIMTAPVVAPSELNPQVPPALDSVVLRALARDPKARFSCVRALSAALLPFASAQVRSKWEPEMAKSCDPDRGVEIAEKSLSPARGRSPMSKVAVLAPLLLAGWLTVSLSAKRREVPSAPAVIVASVQDGIAPSTRAPARGVAGEGPLSPPTPPSAAASAMLLPASGVSAVARSAPHAPKPRPIASSPPVLTENPNSAREKGQASASTVERGTRNIPIVE